MDYEVQVLPNRTTACLTVYTNYYNLKYPV